MSFDHELLSGSLRDFYDYWNGLRPAPDLFPRHAQISMTGLRPFIPYVSLIEKRPPDDDYYYRLKGTGFTNVIESDPTGKKVRDVLHESLRASLLEGLDQVQSTGVPYLGKAAFDDKNGVHRKYTRLIVPLADDGKNIDIFLIYGCPEN